MKNLFLLVSCIFCVVDRCSSFSASKASPPRLAGEGLKQRRQILHNFISSTVAGIAIAGSQIVAPSNSYAVSEDDLSSLKNFVYGENWIGTSLSLLSPQEAATWQQPSYDMGRWPDPILRRPATAIDVSKFGMENMSSVANKLRKTARENGAVGLAAQQCGIDVSIIFVDDPKRIKKKQKDDGEGGLFLVNPRILERSPEVDMKVWREECLVLPPSFTATVLRDNTVTVQYDNLVGESKKIKLRGEVARCLQHELDHDRGILITDHVEIGDLESGAMKKIEAVGHDDRMALAYSRFISEESFDDFSSRSSSQSKTSVARDFLVQPANAVEDVDISPTRTQTDDTNVKKADIDPTPVCDDACKEERKKRIQERRAMMQQSRSSTQRSEVFELSKQRAKLYGTEYQGASCAPGIPCI